MAPPRQVPDALTIGVWALLFAASASATIITCQTMSMVWMRMPGQTWPGAAASFLGMWLAMMVAMMTPSLAPSLWRARLGRLTPLAATGYFFVWTMIGVAIYPLGATLAAIARLTPIAVGAIILGAAALQFTVCRMSERGRRQPVDATSAWNYGLRLGLDCAWCCAGYMTMLLVLGITNLRAMAVVTAAITVERARPRRRNTFSRHEMRSHSSVRTPRRDCDR